MNPSMQKAEQGVHAIYRQAVFLMIAAVLMSGCVAGGHQSVSAAPVEPSPSLTAEDPGEQKDEARPAAVPTTAKTAQEKPTQTKSTDNSEAAATQPGGLKPTNEPTRPSPEQWKEWPVLPSHVSEELRQVYQQGLKRGNDPHAFSFFGDCQSQPDVFMGVFDSEPEMVKQLPDHLQETVAQFSGSFDRYSPTVKDGTTEGALLWAQWNDNVEKKCTEGETPVDCELRVHKPSIVFIHVGTHWEARNRRYLSMSIDKILEHGAVPVLVTKADNRELDGRVNHNLASLAEEYDLPLWNFWSSVQHLPEHGMEPGSDMYLSEEGLEIHRQGGLEALDAVWRALNP